ncbi:phosphatase PAP2 family protein [Nocardioides bizhenqiangii]|uniref:Phosphatase PAP2 family protein n=1 Tax=Nocardioides bizhenqiangii TaxID=3095076 RepID=A0ABZ0ZRF1_9ACTN|nr:MULTISPECIES: phosphatase PAP2 family protein [unclassified Nocardioides]MDZ5622636.1 phosphatase PAP2 family protein [Nocardioides sp. HM23]WQQ26905.1 phosphatase PAP2 family protein [Nocardioides sp. HM61]
MYRRAYTLLIGTAVAIYVATCVVALAYDRPPVEPEGKLLGPSLTWVLEMAGGVPTSIWLLNVVLLIDVLLRALTVLIAAVAVDLAVGTVVTRRGELFRRGGASDDDGPSTFALFRAAAGDRWRTRWTRERTRLVVVGTVCFYMTYVCYRNLKSNLPFVRPDPNRDPGEVKALSYDRELHVMDKVLFFGHDPSDVLHTILGTTFTAHILSQVYLTYLPLVILLVVVWLVWSRNVSFGYWFVTSQVVAWTLGTLSYYLLPTLGPGIEYPSEYEALSHTPTTDLMKSITDGRFRVLYDTTLEGALNSVAGFASLHVTITVLWALMVQYTVRSRILQWVFWVNAGLTVIATIYFGWHYVADDIAGIAIAIVSFYLGGIASGQKFDRGMRSHPTTTTSKVPVERS